MTFTAVWKKKTDEGCLDEVSEPLSQIKKQLRQEGMTESAPKSSLCCELSLIQMYKFQGFEEKEELYVLRDQNRLVVGFATFYWDGPSTPVKVVQITREKKLTEWEKEDSAEQAQWLLDALIQTKETRLSQFKLCEFCGAQTPPEHRFDDQTCHSCASIHYGVVY